MNNPLICGAPACGSSVAIALISYFLVILNSFQDLLLKLFALISYSEKTLLSFILKSSLCILRVLCVTVLNALIIN